MASVTCTAPVNIAVSNTRIYIKIKVNKREREKFENKDHIY